MNTSLLPRRGSCFAACLFAFFLVGCETTDTGGSAEAASADATSGNVGSRSGGALPLQARDDLWAARAALVSLADGSATEPETAYETVLQGYSTLSTFGDRLESLENAFNDTDFRYLWNQLESMGSIYQINTASFTGDQLRALETELRGFRNNVYDLNRVYTDYMANYDRLVETVGQEVNVELLQNSVPFVNVMTQQSVRVDEQLQAFHEALMELGKALKERQYESQF